MAGAGVWDSLQLDGTLSRAGRLIGVQIRCDGTGFSSELERRFHLAHSLNV